MARGRKKDLTIPPTRALTQQRDYRARRARYVTSLEERCRRVEEENARLREELAAVKANFGIVPLIPGNHETVSMSFIHQHVVTGANFTGRGDCSAHAPTLINGCISGPLPASSVSRASFQRC